MGPAVGLNALCLVQKTCFGSGSKSQMEPVSPDEHVYSSAKALCGISCINNAAPSC